MKKGNASYVNEDWADEIKYSFNDLAYLWARKERIDKIFTFLQALNNRGKSNSHYITFKELCDKYKIDYRISKVMRITGIMNEKLEINIERNLNYADAIEISLELRNLYRIYKIPKIV